MTYMYRYRYNEVYSMQHYMYVIKFVSDLQKVDFLLRTMVPIYISTFV
jgi:hypothetical protein